MLFNFVFFLWCFGALRLLSGAAVTQRVSCSLREENLSLSLLTTVCPGQELFK